MQNHIIPAKIPSDSGWRDPHFVGVPATGNEPPRADVRDAPFDDSLCMNDISEPTEDVSSGK